MTRWVGIMINNGDAQLTMYDSYTEAVTESRAIYETMTDKPDAYKVQLMRVEDQLEVLCIGYDVVACKEYLNFEMLLELSDMNMSSFSKAYGIPYRTIQNWKVANTAPIYMLSMLAIAIFNNKEVKR